LAFSKSDETFAEMSNSAALWRLSAPWAAVLADVDMAEFS
jgi:hypothetical protein